MRGDERKSKVGKSSRRGKKVEEGLNEKGGGAGREGGRQDVGARKGKKRGKKKTPKAEKQKITNGE